MTEEELRAIEERTNKATPGPWRWTHDEWNAAKYRRETRNGRFVALPGQRLRNAWIALLLGRFLRDPDQVKGKSVAEWVQRGIDEWDFKQVFALAWTDIKGDAFDGGFKQEDQEFIAHAREDIPALIAEVRRQRALLGQVRDLLGQAESDTPVEPE